jgi:hypothetical protein
LKLYKLCCAGLNKYLKIMRSTFSRLNTTRKLDDIYWEKMDRPFLKKSTDIGFFHVNDIVV